MDGLHDKLCQLARDIIIDDGVFERIDLGFSPETKILMDETSNFDSLDVAEFRISVEQEFGLTEVDWETMAPATIGDYARCILKHNADIRRARLSKIPEDALGMVSEVLSYHTETGLSEILKGVKTGGLRLSDLGITEVQHGEVLLSLCELVATLLPNQAPSD